MFTRCVCEVGTLGWEPPIERLGHLTEHLLALNGTKKKINKINVLSVGHVHGLNQCATCRLLYVPHIAKFLSNLIMNLKTSL